MLHVIFASNLCCYNFKRHLRPPIRSATRKEKGHTSWKILPYYFITIWVYIVMFGSQNIVAHHYYAIRPICQLYMFLVLSLLVATNLKTASFLHALWVRCAAFFVLYSTRRKIEFALVRKNMLVKWFTSMLLRKLNLLLFYFLVLVHLELEHSLFVCSIFIWICCLFEATKQR